MTPECRCSLREQNVLIAGAINDLTEKDSTMAKSTVDEIRERFDNDVERFSNLETGQSAAIDASISLELVAKAANAATPNAKRLLDIGCGAGNFSLRTLGEGSYQSVTLVDLSQPMLERAVERIQGSHDIEVASHQTDIRKLEFGREEFDVVFAGAVLHHLRTDEEWDATFRKIFDALRPGGSFWIFDMVVSENEAVHKLQEERYGRYLSELKDDEYRDHVFSYIEKEDTPKPLIYQLELLRKVGFSQVDVLHFNTRFAAFGGVK